jgi:DNA recombination protein RmuC
MAIQIIKQVRKDAQMREAADMIRSEVGYLLKDIGLLSERVNKLKTHLGQTTGDIDQILISTGKIEKRAAKIEEMEFEGVEQPALPMGVTRTLRAAE